MTHRMKKENKNKGVGGEQEEGQTHTHTPACNSICSAEGDAAENRTTVFPSSLLLPAFVVGCVGDGQMLALTAHVTS